jgi:hypothetical protein
MLLRLEYSRRSILDGLFRMVDDYEPVNRGLPRIGGSSIYPARLYLAELLLLSVLHRPRSRLAGVVLAKMANDLVFKRRR